jgi:hypothetical protein
MAKIDSIIDAEAAIADIMLGDSDLPAAKPNADVTDKRQGYSLDFAAEMTDKEASDPTLFYKIVVEKTYDGSTWEFVAGYVWQGGEIGRDGNPVKPGITVQFAEEDAKDRPVKFRLMTNAPAESSLVVSKLVPLDKQPASKI